MFDDLKVSEWWFLGIAAFFGYLVVKHFVDKLPGNQTGSPGSAEALDWHQVLEVGAGASLEEIKQAYKRKIGLYHPDKVAGLGPEFTAIAEVKAKEINEAYQQGCAARGGEPSRS
ncbi:J domain-containing protein [Hydrogenophaga sp.]|uniref:J domain-containing protein n=1 Tax=Hydrogenophaga sp. TaxID=1904254 RepID=UPI0025BB7773|nr:J domain-containing protein [Hydrogenophaga sp.]